MDTNFRDNAIAKNRLLFKLTLFWACSTTFVIVVLSCLCFYAFNHKQVHWMPVCTGSEFSIGDNAYSPAYLKAMTEKSADLRLTYNPETIGARYAALVNLIPASHLEEFKKRLDGEIVTVKKKNISSVFYAEKVAVDVKKHQGQIDGLLYRTSHGLQLKPRHKTWMVQFSFNNGVLGLVSMKEIYDAKN